MRERIFGVKHLIGYPMFLSTQKMYTKLEHKLFTDPNGAQSNNDDFPIRVVLSSFYWPNASGGSGLQGIPDGKSDCSLCTSNCDSCQSVAKVDAYDESSTGYDKDYTRVHRDPAIVKAMREWVGL